MLYLDITFHRSKGLKPLGGGHSLIKHNKKISKLRLDSALAVHSEFYIYVSHGARLLIPDWGIKSFSSPNTNPDPIIIPKSYYGCSLLYWDVGFYNRLIKAGLATGD